MVQMDVIKKALPQAALPLCLVLLLLAIIIAAAMFGQNGKRPHKPAARDAKALVVQVNGLLTSIHQKMTDVSYPVDEAIEKITPKPPPPPPAPVMPVAPTASASVAEKLPPPPPPKPPPEAVLIVTGIVSSEHNALVCVNNRILGVGGVVEGFKIVKIEPHQVIFDNQKGRIRIIRFK